MRRCGEEPSRPHVVLDLTPLDEAAARELGEGLSGVESRRLAACVERAGGNPLFLEQLLFSDVDTALPDTVQSLVQARMDRLPAADKLALSAASVIGQRFSVDVVRYLVEAPKFDCGALAERNLVRREGEDASSTRGRPTRFYASVEKTRRGRSPPSSTPQPARPGGS